jgi:hypothetical protein
MTKCPHCSTEIVDELNFCVNCEEQINCLHCGTHLFKDKSRCLKCGEPIKAQISEINEMNTYTLEEKTTKSTSYRRVEIRASDSALGVWKPGMGIDSGVPLQPFIGQDRPSGDSLPALTNLSVNSAVVNPGPERREENRDSDSDAFDPEVLFAKNSDNGISPGKSLRDYLSRLPSKKERQEVFITLFVWAYKKVCSEACSSENIISAMKNDHLYDGHSSQYLSETIKNYFVVTSGKHEINNYDGVKKVNEILDSMKGNKVTSNIIDVKKNNRKNRPPGKIGKDETAIVNPWTKLIVENLNEFDARKLKNASDWAVFGLYVLTKILKVQETIDPDLVYVYLKIKFPIISVQRKNFVEKMRTMDKKFIRSVSGAYSLTEIAEKEIRELIQGISV